MEQNTQDIAVIVLAILALISILFSQGISAWNIWIMGSEVFAILFLLCIIAISLPG